MSNTVILTAGTVAAELIQLAAESYGNLPVFHMAETLAFQSDDTSLNETLRASARRWHPLSAFEVGMLPAQTSNISYSFQDGSYQAYDGDRFDSSKPEASAEVLTGLVNGVPTLAISFRGTDQESDVNYYPDFGRYFEQFTPLINNIIKYIEDSNNGVLQVLISGHSLGAAAAQYMDNEISVLAHHPRALVFTDGSPGAEIGSNLSNILNFINTNDIVPDIGESSDSLAIRAAIFAVFGPLGGIASSLIKPKIQGGTKIFLDTGLSQYPSTVEHDKYLYAYEISSLSKAALDFQSPFSATVLAHNIKDGDGYAGQPIYLAVQNNLNNEIHVSASDQFALGDNSKIYIDNPYKTQNIHIIDGGEQGSTLIVNGRETEFLQKTNIDQFGVETDLIHQGEIVDKFYRIEQIEFMSEELPCFCSGTKVLTPGGYVEVECLAIGDLVATRSGQLRPVRWIGCRHLDLTRHRNPSSVWPVRVAAGAVSDNLPIHDLWMSPGHNVCVNDVLIASSLLVNGRTVTQEKVDQVTYWHIELDCHDIILAEGLPTESYLDTGNREAFENGGAFIDAHPDFKPKRWAETCLPLVTSGPEVEAERTRLLARAVGLGHVLSDSADMHVVVDGLRIEPIDFGRWRIGFALPAHCQAIVLRSRTFVAGHVEPASIGDDRELGLCIGRLQIDGEDIDLRDDLPAEGWHALESYGEHVQRWTTGATPLPAGARLAIIDLCGHGRYWLKPRENVVALFG